MVARLMFHTADLPIRKRVALKAEFTHFPCSRIELPADDAGTAQIEQCDHDEGGQRGQEGQQPRVPRSASVVGCS